MRKEDLEKGHTYRTYWRQNKHGETSSYLTSLCEWMAKTDKDGFQIKAQREVSQKAYLLL